MLWRNLVYAARSLRANPGFTAIAVLTVALGIGANTAIFSLVDAVLLRPLPYARSRELVTLKDDIRSLNLRNIGMSVPEMDDLRDRSGVFAELSASWAFTGNLTGSDRPERIQAVAVSPNYFEMLGAKPQIGRVFGPEDRADGFAETVILSDTGWRRLFGGDAHALGKKIRLDNDLYEVVGVMPPGFRHPGPSQDAIDAWFTCGFRAAPFAAPPQRAARLIPGALARLQPGLTLEQAQAKLDSFTDGLALQYPDVYRAGSRWNVRLTGLQEDLSGDLRTTLLLVFGAVLCVLLICCVSLANLVVARALARHREIAIRRALGAPWGELARQLLSESLLLAGLGGALGWVAVLFAAPLLPRVIPVQLPVGEIAVDGPVLWFAVAASLVTGFLFGLAPLVPILRTDVVAHLREGGRGRSASASQTRLRSVLVGCEVALSLALMMSAGLLLRSFWNLYGVDPGFKPQNLLVASIWLPIPNDPAKQVYRTPETRNSFAREVLRRARTLPGVEYAAIGNSGAVPFTGSSSVNFRPEGFVFPHGQEALAQQMAVSPDFFRAMGAKLLRGRVFTESDEKGPVVVLVDETLASRYWPGQDAVGKRLAAGRSRDWLTIAGVVSNLKTQSMEAPDTPHIYYSIYQRSTFDLRVLLRLSRDPAPLASALRHEIQTIDPDLPVAGVRTMQEVIDESLVQRRFQLRMIGAFAGVALLLAALGIYGVTAFWVSQRAQEIGIRIALGAQSGEVVRLVLGQGLRLTVWGLGAGLAISIPLARALRSLLFGTGYLDPWTLAAVPLVLAATAAAACYLPARRATRLNPISTLRAE
jgi:putative ABC transport system permease protein